MRIIVDVMSGDNAPFETLKGICEAKSYDYANGVDFTLVGDEGVIRRLANENKWDKWRVYMSNTQFRFATEQDTALILDFIKSLAEYERMSDQVVATEEILREWIFEKKKAEVIFAIENDKEVGFALFFHNFSTFLGRSGIYLEDLFVRPEYRGKGHGKALIRELARITLERGCGRLEWCCLDWNKPSIDFYLSLGAVPMDEWTIYRLTGDNLKSFANE